MKDSVDAESQTMTVQRILLAVHESSFFLMTLFVTDSLGSMATRIINTTFHYLSFYSA